MTIVRINGMSCQHCVASTRNALEAIEGISNVEIDLNRGTATYEGSVSPDVVSQAIAAIGFEVVEN